ncbi:MAG: branched-chain amino acid transport system substrate-binding protein [Candidatus Omnitrophota bacterium]|jgi:branched-chain amino acid transport system substrate-binding protein
MRRKMIKIKSNFIRSVDVVKKSLLVASLILLTSTWVYAESQPSIRIYIDADRTGAKASGLAIEQGVRTALSEVENRLVGRQTEIVIRDHRGSSPRSLTHMKEYLEDDLALVIFSGLHSPPLLAHREFINKNQILVLDPWAAAGPITRYPSKDNWIFRLSIDDSKAGYVIADHAIRVEGFAKPYLLLEDTGWGKSNHKTMNQALTEMGVASFGVEWFNWGLDLTSAEIILRRIYDSGADVIFMVANVPEGKTFAKAMALLLAEKRLPIRSHWGITGGDFPDVIGSDMRMVIDLEFLQTSFSFINHTDHLLGEAVLQKAKAIFPETIKTAIDIKAPNGFVHAYDLTRLLIAAVNQVDFTDDIKINRDLVRKALENIEQPINGLIKTYVKPFSVYSANNPDAHEALSRDDFVMARYGEKGEIILDDYPHRTTIETDQQ